MVATLARVDTVPMVPVSQGEEGSRVAAQATVRGVHGSSCSAGWVASKQRRVEAVIQILWLDALLVQQAGHNSNLKISPG
jgi:hypothetical protein